MECCGDRAERCSGGEGQWSPAKSKGNKVNRGKERCLVKRRLCWRGVLSKLDGGLRIGCQGVCGRS